MAIREFKNKKGITYEVRINYKDKYGLKKYYSKRGFTSKRQAQNHEKIMKAKILQGFEKTNNLTFDEAFKKWIDNSGLAHSTIQSRKLSYRKHIKPTLGNIDLKKIDYEIINNLLEIKSHELSTSTMQGLVAILKHVFNFCYNNTFIERMPFSELKIKGKTNTKKKNKIIDNETFKMMIDDAEPYYKLAFYIAHYTGCRLGEILALTRNDIDLENDTISIDKSLFLDPISHELIISDAKTESSNAIIPLVKPLKKILIKYFERDNCDIVVNRDGDYISPSLVKAKIRRFNKKYDKHVTFHMFRHTYTTLLYKNNIDPKTAQKLLRHKDYNTTMTIYTHLKEENLKDKVNNIFN